MGRRPSRRVVIVGVAAVAVVGATTSAVAFTSGGGTAYRLASVSSGSVTQTLTTTGAISPIRSADLDFQVAGTVSHVRVKAGKRVHSGEIVATLNRSELSAAVASARSTLVSARQSLANDESSQNSSSSSSADSDNSTSTPTAQPTPAASRDATTADAKPPTGGSSNGGANTKLIAHDQSVLVMAQHQADVDLATAKADIKAAATACASEVSGTTNGSGSADTSACTDATTAVLTAQKTVATDQQAVATAATTLANDLAKIAQSATSPTQSTSPTPEPSKTSSGTTSHSSVTPSAASASTVSASQLASDEATIDKDRGALATARANRRQAVLKSPIAGRVAAVTVRHGDTVSGTATAGKPAVEVVGSKQSEVTIDLTAAQVREVSRGQVADVTPDGASKAVAGHVTTIGHAVTDATTGDVTYPVIVLLSAHATSLISGADAAVTITLATAHNVLLVPTSAVHRSGTKAYVEVMSAGHVARRTVTVGAIGASTTQIRSGVSIGDEVVLANLNEAVPSSSTNLLNGRNSFNRSFSGGGGPTFSISGGPSGGPPSGSGFSSGR